LTAVPDLPTEQWDTIVTEIIRWWNENAGAASLRESGTKASRGLPQRGCCTWP
jgi:hypothetical protein